MLTFKEAFFYWNICESCSSDLSKITICKILLRVKILRVWRSVRHNDLAFNFNKISFMVSASSCPQLLYDLVPTVVVSDVNIAGSQLILEGKLCRSTWKGSTLKGIVDF